MNVKCPNCNKDNLNIGESAIGKNILCCNCGAKFLVESEPSALYPPQSQALASELTLDQVRTLWSGTISSQDNNLELSIKPDAKKVTTSSRLQNNIRVMRVGESEEVKEGDKPNDLDLVDFIGSGGMGVVFRANQKSIDRNVAVKIIKPEIAADEGTRENFIREAMVTGNLEHPNIVPVHELGSLDDGTLFYSMKEVKGTPWKEFLRLKSPAENLDILQKVCDAVAFAHGKGIIHRDLKPENVMLGEYGEVMVMDWGLAVNVNRDAQSTNAEILSEESGHAGTPAYMAPEMASCDYRNIGKRSDIYLLGAILYEIVGGVKPHVGKDVLECLHNAAQNIISECSARGELVDIARKAMATKPEARFLRVKDFQKAIRDYQKHAESIALYESAAEHLKKAQSTSNYELYAQAVFGFKEALKLWPDNLNARLKLADTNQEYAKCAYSKNDLDLAMSLLNSVNMDHVDLIQKVDNAYKDRGRKKKLLRALAYGSGGLAAGIILILLVSVLWIQLERSSAVKARDKAEEALAKMKVAQDSEEVAKQETVKVKEIAGKDKLQLAEEVEKAKAAAGKDKLLLAKEAKTAKESAVQAKQEASKIANTSHKYGYKSALLSAKDKIDKSQFAGATETLNSTTTVKRNIEWGLLKNMCNTDNSAKEFEGQFCAISPDEKIIALLLNKGKSLKICNISGEEVCRFDFDENDNTSYKNNIYKDLEDKPRWSGEPFFSPDGKYLLTGNTIFDLNAGKIMRKLPNIAYQVNYSNPFLFSYDSKYLIVRCHDEIRKNINKENNKTSYSITNSFDWIEVYDLATLKLVWTSTRIEKSSQSSIKVSARGNTVTIEKNVGGKTFKINTDILDLRNGKLLGTLDSNVIALSSEGNMAIGRTSDYKNYVLWDIPNNREIQKIAILDFPSNIEFTSDGKKLFGLSGLSGGGGNPNAPRKAKAVSIYDIDKKETKSIELKDGVFESSRSINIEYMPNDCKYAKFSLSSGPGDSSKIVYDLNAGRIIYQISLGRSKTSAVLLSPTASFGISGDDLKTKLTPIFEMTASFRSPSTFNFYAISPDNKLLIMPDFSKRQGFRQSSFIEDLLICDMETRQVKARINIMEVLKGKDEGIDKMINFINLETVKISDDSGKVIIPVKFTENGPPTLGNYVFSMDTGTLIESKLPATPFSIIMSSTLHFAPGSGNIMKITGTSNPDKTQTLSFADSKSNKEYFSVKQIPAILFILGSAPQSEITGIGAVSYSPDKALIAISNSFYPSLANSIIIYNLKKNQIVSTFAELQKPVLFLEFTKDAKRLIGLAPKQTSSPGGAMNPNNYYGYILTIWDLEINEELLSIEHDFGFPIMSMSLSPDGHQIRFGGNKAEIWTASDWTK